jgi:nucleotide-binding universal stress UspA family protein
MYQRIMLTVDGSELARSAIPHAAAIAGDTSTEVIVMSVVETLEAVREHTLGDAYPFHLGDLQKVEEIAESRYRISRTAAEQEVARTAELLRASGVGSVQTMVVDGIAGNAIIDAAQQHQVDAIVMATRGHGGLGREIVGSVAEYVLRHAGTLAVVLAGPRSARET